MMLNRTMPSDEALNAVRLKLQMHKNDLHRADKNNLKVIADRLLALNSQGVNFESSLAILNKQNTTAVKNFLIDSLLPFCTGTRHQ